MYSPTTSPRHAHPNAPACPPAPRRYLYTRADAWSTALIALLALISRVSGLTLPTSQGTPVFDEKHYVPQAWDMVRSNANPLVGGIESNPGFGLVVHPPLGKQLLAVGEMVFGYTPAGWRVMTALFGVGVVLLVMELARRLSHSWLVGFIAGLLAVCDGVLLVGAKFGMLDIFQVFFITAAALALAIDHEQLRHRIHASYTAGYLATCGLGYRAGVRWWRFTAGVMLGLAVSVKWSGLYYMAFFGLLSVALDAALRRRYGVRRPTSGALLLDAIPAFASLVIVPILLYAWSFRAWFASETSVYRHAAADGSIDANSWLHHLPDALAGWFYYHAQVLEFHSSLTSSSGNSHPWDSKPWSWLAATRPVLYSSASDIACADTTCRSAIYLFGTPPIWWLTVPVLCFATWRLLRGDRRYVIPLVAFAAGFLPWLAAFDRQMYFFYAMPLAPFTIVLLALATGDAIGHGRPRAWTRHLAGHVLTTGTFLAIVYVASVVAAFFYWLPLFYGILVPDWYYWQLMWLPSWS
ncbi:dolichyl-phosphate-mannose--protein mannosyltransferase [Corynebacterium uterequi]|uniref:Polyprenol-phosphate-mannose--protein mannosyltransferase n=1 Tax=Corynebacterium uterequi TaxID=1072256 RepID=A0A0G3HBD7_9CORY|nr:phospholipid carrier-dependent glycosyltransferase [Corynebacterium uterequi]AKK10711.1 Dolichyl-phosphate-mannose-protein mannosyltransferase [Corynebacterium uterequi]